MRGRRALGRRGRAGDDDGLHAPLRARARERAGEALEGERGPGVGAALRGRVGRAGRASPSGRWRWPWSTRATASSSAGRSAPTRPSRTAAPRCCSRPRAPARPPTTAPGPRTPSRSSLEQAASMAKAYASDAGWRVCSSSLQVHGGIGFTWEHDLHFFLKRAKVDGLLWGSARGAPRARRGPVRRGRGSRGRSPAGGERRALAPLARQRRRQRRQHPVALPLRRALPLDLGRPAAATPRAGPAPT